jgi:hypothetical protein
MPMTISGSTGLTFNDGTEMSTGQQAVKAWVNFNGTGTVAIRASYNVSSISDTGTGNYIVNFTTAMSDTNYARCVTVGGNATTTGSSVLSPYNAAPTTSSVNVVTFTTSFSGVQDCNEVNVSIFR